MHIQWEQIGGYALAALVALWGFVWRNRMAIVALAGEAVAFSEKYHAGAPAQEMEDEAVRYFHNQWPTVPETVIRVIVRQVCARRKVAAVELGARQP